MRIFVILLSLNFSLLADRIVVMDNYAFVLKEKSIDRYDLTKGPLEEIKFFGEPTQFLADKSIYLLTNEALFKLDAKTGKFLDISPLNKYSYAMALDGQRNRLYLLTANDITVYDVSSKLKPLYSIATAARESYPLIDRETGRLFLVRKAYPWLGLLKPGSRKIRRFKFPLGVERALFYKGKIFGIAQSGFLIYDPIQGKVLSVIPLNQPLKDIAAGSGYVVIAGEASLFLIDPNDYKIIKKVPRTGIESMYISDNSLLSIEDKKVVLLSLPDLKIRKEKSFDKEVVDVKLWQNRLLVLSGDEFITEGIKIEKVEMPIQRAEIPDSLHALQIGAFIEKENLLTLQEELRRRGLAYYNVYEMGMFKLRVGYFESKEEATIFASLLNPYPSWVLYDKIQEIRKPETGWDFNKDGDFEIVINQEGAKIIIFSLKDKIYKKIWESDPHYRYRLIKVEDSGIQVDIDGKEHIIKWEGGQFKVE